MAKKKKKKNIKHKKKFSFLGLGIAIFLLAFFLFSLFTAYKSLYLKPKKKTLTSSFTKIKKEDYTTKNNYFEYEEQIKDDFSLKLEEVDLVIIQSLYANNGEGVKVTSHSYKEREFQNFHFKLQEISLYVPKSSHFIENLATNIKKLTPFASLKKVSPNTYYITIDNILTHSLYLETYIKPFREQKGKLAIIIDDMGRNVRLARSFLNLNLKLTFSFLPFAPYSKKIALETKQNNQGIMLHLPMEPRGYPEKANPGPGALFVSMDLAQINQTCLTDLNKVPFIRGVNNHMGSRFTEYEPGMRRLFTLLKQKNLFFVDSLTTPKSISTKLASEINLPLLKRDIFLDNLQDVNSILFQLKKSEALALKKGKAIAIGHPYPATLEALKKWKRQKSPQLKLVLPEELL